GNREAGCPLIQVDAANEFEGGQEVGAGVAQVLIADAGGEVEHAGGRASELGGVAAALHVNGANGVGGDAQLQRAAHRVGNVEAVHGVERLVSVAAHHVRLSRVVLYDAGDIGQDVAVIAGNGIGDVDDVEAGKSAGVGDFLRINGRRGLDHIDLLLDLLHVVQFDFDSAARSAYLHGLGCGVEAFFF